MSGAIAPAVGSVLDVLRTVDDPEYPGVSIVDLGLVADVRVGAAGVAVDLIPTFSGCPALGFIATDVERALVAAGFADHDVRFVSAPVWTPERIDPLARAALAETLAVAVKVGSTSPACPRCGSRSVTETAMFGPTRCRSVAHCDSCGEHLEVIR